MALKGNQHVVPHRHGWAVKSAGGQRATSVHPTQSAAISAAREIAVNNRSEMLIHRPDGRITGRNSYGNDQIPTRRRDEGRREAPRRGGRALAMNRAGAEPQVVRTS